MTSTHKIDACRYGTVNGQDFDEEYVITFSYTKGGGDNWNEPAYGPTIEFVRVDPPVPTDGSVSHPDLMQQRINQWAEDWLDDNYSVVVAAAQYDLDAQADDYADFKRRQRIDDKLTGDNQ